MTPTLSLTRELEHDAQDADAILVDALERIARGLELIVIALIAATLAAAAVVAAVT